MSLSDIFDEPGAPPTTATPVQAPTASQTPHLPLGELAAAACRAHDAADDAAAEYEAVYGQMLAEVQRRTIALRERKEAAQQVANEAHDTLRTQMQVQKVDAVALPDRGPATLKTTPGKHLPITKTFLDEEFPKEAAMIWRGRKRADPSHEVVFPRRPTP